MYYSEIFCEDILTEVVECEWTIILLIYLNNLLYSLH